MEILVKKIPVKDLVDFAAEVDMCTPAEGVLPITQKRARAHRQNPFADPDDIGLLVAYSDDVCVGYLGILPGLVRVNGQVAKVLWLSTWYVHPTMRKSGVGLRLLSAACELGCDIAATGASNSASRFFQGFHSERIHFSELGQARYCRYSIIRPGRRRLLGRLRSEVLRMDKGTVPALDKPLEKIDQLTMDLVRSRFLGQALASLRSQPADVELRQVSRIRPPDAFAGIRDDSPGSFVRDIRIVNWMLEYPWVMESGGGRDPRYEFSSVQQLFRYIAIEIISRTDGNYLGYLVMLVSRERIGDATDLIVVDWNIAREVTIQTIADAILRRASEYRAERLTLPLSFARELPRPPAFFGELRENSRPCFARPWSRNSALSKALQQPVLDYCDGDIAFA